MTRASNNSDKKCLEEKIVVEMRTTNMKQLAFKNQTFTSIVVLNVVRLKFEK